MQGRERRGKGSDSISFEQLTTGSYGQCAQTDSKLELGVVDVHVDQALELLLGRTPRGELETAEALPTIAPVSAGLPATAMVRRHDVVAALWRLASADASAAAAAKALLPGIRLTGDVSRDTGALSGFSDATTIWSVLGLLTQPIFQRGLLKARSDASRLELEAAWEDYRAVILRAVGEVEDALSRERSLARQRDHVGAALREANRNREIFEGRYRAGLASVLELLQAENQRMDVNRQVLALDGEILSNRITLALAVGAGFEEDSEG